VNAAEDLPPAEPVGKRDPQARLAEIKQRAAQGARSALAGDLDEEKLIAQAALGVAQRREIRGDLVGAMTWEEIARNTAAPGRAPDTSITGTGHPAPGEHQSSDSGAGQAVPVRQTRQDGHDGDEG
jgi:hypothetical protein